MKFAAERTILRRRTKTTDPSTSLKAAQAGKEPPASGIGVASQKPGRITRQATDHDRCVAIGRLKRALLLPPTQCTGTGYPVKQFLVRPAGLPRSGVINVKPAPDSPTSSGTARDAHLPLESVCLLASNCRTVYDALDFYGGSAPSWGERAGRFYAGAATRG